MINLLESIGSKLQDGGFMLLLGMCVVFFGMLIIVLFVTLFGKVITKVQSVPKKEKVEKVSVSKDETGLSDEEVAAIVAAINCFYGDNKRCDFVVRKIKKI